MNNPAIEDMVTEIDTTLYRWKLSLPKDVGTPLDLDIALEMAQIKGALDALAFDDKDWGLSVSRMWKRYLVLKSRMDGTDAVTGLVDMTQSLFDVARDSVGRFTTKEDKTC